MVRATFEALKSASSPKIIAMRRGLKINDITKRRKINQSGLDNGKKLELNKLKVQLEEKGVQRKILISLGLNKINREKVLKIVLQ